VCVFMCVKLAFLMLKVGVADPLNGGKCQKLSTKTVRDVVLDYYTIQYKVVM